MANKSPSASANDAVKDKDNQDMTRQTLKGLSWMFSGTSARSILQTLVLVVLARLLTPEEFGLLATATIIIKFAENASFMGLTEAIVQRAELTMAHIRTGFTLSVLLGIALTGIVWFLTPWLARFFEVEALTEIMKVLVWIFPIHSISVIAEALLNRALKFNKLAIVEIVSYILGYITIAVPLALMGYGVWALVTATMVGAAVKSIAYFVLQPHQVRPQLDWQACKDLTYLGGGFTLGGLVNYFAVQGDFIVVGRYLGPAALGLYSKAYNLMAMPISLFGRALRKVLFSTMSRMQDEVDRLSVAYRRGSTLVALLTLPTGVVSLILAPEIIHVVLGPQWTGAIAPFQVLALGMFLRIGYRVAATVVTAQGLVYRTMWRQAIYAVAVIGGALFGQEYGISGVAWGVLFALVLYFLMMSYLAIQITNMTWQVFASAHRPAVLVSVIMGGVAWGVAFLARNTGLDDILVLATAGIAALGIGTGLLWFSPRFMIGDDGLWWVQTLLQYTGADRWFTKKSKVVHDKAEGEGKKIHETAN